MARAEIFVVDDANPDGHWIWIGGYEGLGIAPTWAGTPASLVVNALSGQFQEEGVDQVWVGNSAPISVNAASGTFVAGPAGSKFLALSGASGAKATVPDEPNLRLSGAHKLRMRMRKADWTPAAYEVLLSKWGAVGTWAWLWRLQTTGNPYFQWSYNGDVVTAAPTGPAPSPAMTPNEIIWVQFEILAANRQVIMSTHPDQEAEPTTGWTAVSTSTTSSALNTISQETTTMTIGSYVGGANYLAADIFQICLRNSSDTLVFKLDPDNWTSGSTWVTSTGHTVTLEGTASIGTD